MSDKPKITTLSKMWNALNENERVRSVFVLVIVASLFLIVWSFKFGRNTAKVPVVLTNEVVSSVIGVGDNFYAFAFTTTQVEGKNPSILSSDVENLRYPSVYGQVIDNCFHQDSAEDKSYLSVKIWVDGDEENAQTFCVAAGTYIIIGNLSDSFWDETEVNGFARKRWNQFIVAPYLSEPSPSATPAAIKTKQSK